MNIVVATVLDLTVFALLAASFLSKKFLPASLPLVVKALFNTLVLAGASTLGVLSTSVASGQDPEWVVGLFLLGIFLIVRSCVAIMADDGPSY